VIDCRSMLNVQTFLLTHTLNDLIRDHGVYHRFSTQNPLKFSLNYDQLEAKDADPISQECRGLVLWTETPVAGADSIVGPTEVLAAPMGRFFNFGQGAAAPVNLDSPDTCFYEKLDGTLCILYRDPNLGKWCVATRSVPDADLPMDGFGMQTFTDLFWKAFAASGAKPEKFNFGAVDYTYCFELCTPDNQIVVRYPDYKVYLLAVKDNISCTELVPKSFAEHLGVECAPTYRFGSTAEMLDFVSSRNPLAHEGVVVCDKDYNRVKVKNAGYLAYNKIKDSVAKSPRAVLEVILLGKEDDVMPLVPPHIGEIILSTKENLRVLLLTLDEEYARLHNADRKTFALAVQAGSGHLGPHMARWGGKCQNAHGWVHLAKKDGSWPDSFLDTLLRMAKREV